MITVTIKLERVKLAVEIAQFKELLILRKNDNDK